MSGTVQPPPSILLAQASTWSAEQTFAKAKDTDILTFSNTTDSVTTRLQYYTDSTTVSDTLTFIANTGNGHNVLSLMNENAAGTSAVMFCRNDGVVNSAVGYANSGIGAPFTSATFLESCSLDFVSAPPPLKFIQTGVFPDAGYASRQRQVFTNDGEISFYWTDGATKLLSLTKTRYSAVVAKSGSGIFSFQNTVAAGGTEVSSLNSDGTLSHTLGIANSAYSTYGVLSANRAFSYTAAAVLALCVDNASGAIVFGTGASGGTERMRIGTSLISFGGTTSSFPALKRSSTVLQARLADDSDFAPLQGKLRANANAVAETPTATHTLRLFDAAGTEYKVLAVAA